MTIEVPAEASGISRSFWEAAARQKLVRPVCDECGTNFFVPQIACVRCHSEAWTYQESSGRGTITTFTVVHRAPTSDHQPPYIVAIIDLDEDWYMMSNIIGCAHESVRIGQRVAVDFHRRADGIVLPVFRLSEDEPQ